MEKFTGSSVPADYGGEKSSSAHTPANESEAKQGKGNSDSVPRACKWSHSNHFEIDGAASYNVYIKKAVGCHVGDRRNCTHRPSAKGDKWLLECVSHLQLQHSTRNANMHPLLWYDRSRDYSLEDYFVNLQMDEDDLMGRFKKHRNIEQQELFASLEHKAPTMRILITGRPGFGKTTLVKKLAYDWATLKHPHYLSKFDLVIAIHLRKLGNRSLAEELQRILVLQPEELSLTLQATNLEILLLLDRFDELSETQDILQLLKAENQSYRYSSKMTILVTSRPHAVETLRMEFQRRLTITGFTKENQVKYVNLSMGRCSKIANKFLSQLQTNSFLSQLAECPLMLHILCCLHQDVDLTCIRRMTDLYIEIFTLTIRRYTQKYSEHSSLQAGKYLPGETLLAKFGAVAFMYLCKQIPSIRKSDLKRVFSDKEYETIKRLDFLVGSQVYTKSGAVETEFEVLHRTFTEFLSSLHLAVNYELIKVLERKKTFVNVYGIKHHSKDIELALVDNETFLLCYFGLTNDRSTLNHSLKFPLQLATGKNVSLLSHLRNEVNTTLWKECATIMNFLRFNCGKDSTIDLRMVLKESFLEELVLHFSTHCTLTHIKDVFEAAGGCESLKSIVIHPKTYVSMRLISENGDINTVIFHVDLGLSLDAILHFFSLRRPVELKVKLVGQEQYIYDVTRKSSYCDFQKSNVMELLVYDSSRNSEGNIFQEKSSLVFELLVENIFIEMRFSGCDYRFGESHVNVAKKIVFFITRDQCASLASHPKLCVFIKKGEIVKL